MRPRQYLALIAVTAFACGSLTGLLVHLAGGTGYEVGMYTATFAVIGGFVATAVFGIEYHARQRKERSRDRD